MYNFILNSLKYIKTMAFISINKDDEKVINDLVKRKFSKSKIHKIITENKNVR